jgi:hypothetical protein
VRQRSRAAVPSRLVDDPFAIMRLASGGRIAHRDAMSGF